MHLIIIKYSYFNYKKTWILFAKNIDIDKEIRLSTGFNERSDRILTKRPRWRAIVYPGFEARTTVYPAGEPTHARAQTNERSRLPWLRTKASQLGNQAKQANQQADSWLKTRKIFFLLQKINVKFSSVLCEHSSLSYQLRKSFQAFILKTFLLVKHFETFHIELFTFAFGLWNIFAWQLKLKYTWVQGKTVWN